MSRRLGRPCFGTLPGRRHLASPPSRLHVRASSSFPSPPPSSPSSTSPSPRAGARAGSRPRPCRRRCDTLRDHRLRRGRFPFRPDGPSNRKGDGPGSNPRVHGFEPLRPADGDPKLSQPREFLLEEREETPVVGTLARGGGGAATKQRCDVEDERDWTCCTRGIQAP